MQISVKNELNCKFNIDVVSRAFHACLVSTPFHKCLVSCLFAVRSVGRRSVWRNLERVVRTLQWRASQLQSKHGPESTTEMPRGSREARRGREMRAAGVFGEEARSADDVNDEGSSGRKREAPTTTTTTRCEAPPTTTRRARKREAPTTTTTKKPLPLPTDPTTDQSHYRPPSAYRSLPSAYYSPLLLPSAPTTVPIPLQSHYSPRLQSQSTSTVYVYVYSPSLRLRLRLQSQSSPPTSPSQVDACSRVATEASRRLLKGRNGSKTTPAQGSQPESEGAREPKSTSPSKKREEKIVIRGGQCCVPCIPCVPCVYAVP